MSIGHIPFNKAFIAGRELYYIAQAVANGDLKGDGPFTRKCAEWFKQRMGANACLLTHSCTAALEMSALLIGLEKGDEVILPSFTFTSTANAFLLRGATPRFVDIRSDTLNIDERAIEEAINENTKAICVVHYAGIACAMEKIQDIARRHGIYVIEDAAHAVMAKYKGRYLGTLGELGTYSFHETKNYSSGEGGALLINSDEFAIRAEIIREKGTNRSQFFRGEVDKYSWVDIGSSFLPSEIISAFLYGQLENADQINQQRLRIWNRYYEELKPLEDNGALRLPIIPAGCEHNAHLFYILLDNFDIREDLRLYLNERGCSAVFHYLPLHASQMGVMLGYQKDEFPVTNRASDTILRLPLYCGLSEEEQEHICSTLREYFESNKLAKAGGI